MDGAEGESLTVTGQESTGATDMPDEAVDIEAPARVGVPLFPFADRNTEINRHAFDLRRIGKGLVHGAARATAATGHGVSGRRQRE